MKKLAILLALLGLLLATGPAYAQSGGPYDLTWNSIDGGGVTFATAGPYTLGGTAGQADAGVLQGGPYVLGGGFWMGGAASGGAYRVYLPVVVRNY
jgi:hypothetical protein